MKLKIHFSLSILVAVILCSCGGGKNIDASIPQPSSSEETISSESSTSLIELTTSETPFSEEASIPQPSSSEETISSESSTSLIELTTSETPFSEEASSVEFSDEASSVTSSPSIHADGTELLTDKKGHGQVDSNYVDWYLAGVGSLWEKGNWSKDDAIQLFSNPSSATDKGCVLEIALQAGDIFKVTDYGSSWFGYEGVDTFESPDNLGQLNFEGADDGYKGMNIRCKVDGIYNMYINESGVLWIENAEFQVITAQQAHAIADSWTIEAARNEGYTKCKMIVINGEERREETFSIGNRWKEALDFSLGMIFSYEQRSWPSIFKAKGTALESREYDQDGCCGVIRTNRVGLFEYAKSFPNYEIHYVWLKG